MGAEGCLCMLSSLPLLVIQSLFIPILDKQSIEDGYFVYEVMSYVLNRDVSA
jgi:hypothetical protein